MAEMQHQPSVNAPFPGYNASSNISDSELQ